MWGRTFYSPGFIRLFDVASLIMFIKNIVPILNYQQIAKNQLFFVLRVKTYQNYLF
jgi:hypothetical protein